MKCRYEAVKERVHSDELGEYETFGIRVTTEIASVSDVSIDGARVDELCRQFNDRCACLTQSTKVCKHR